MNAFGLVTEGVTDQVVIENILMGYFEDPDLLVNSIQPLFDATDKAKSPGGWGNLLAYLKSEAFQQTFQTSKYVVIQIDTDKSEEFGVPKNDANGILSIETLIAHVTAKLIDEIGEDFYDLVKERIIFAISVDEIECWLLPIYFSDKKRQKTTGCISTLNKILPQKEGFYIHEKRYNDYDKLSRPFLKKKQLDKLYPLNPSFRIFIDRLSPCER